MTTAIFRIATALALAGALSGPAQAKPDEVSEADVHHCRLLSTVDGTSGYGKNLGWRPIAKADAEHKAGRLGATHIVFTDFRQIGAFNGEANAKAYLCH